jgi:tRNA/rRNA methyltransferase
MLAGVTLGEQKADRAPEVARGPRVVLVRTKESANVGSVARAMLNFGLHDLWLVAPRCRIDRRSFDLATHAEAVLENAKVVDSLEDAIADTTLAFGTSARPRKAENYPLFTPRTVAPRLKSGTAVVFGPEDHGLSNDELTRCQAQIIVPTVDFASLNLAQAVLVVAYEYAQAAGGAQPLAAGGAYVQAAGGVQAQAAGGVQAQAAGGAQTDGVSSEGVTGSAKGGPRHTPASRDQLERFYAQLQALMLKIGYTDERRAPGILRVYRGLIDRAEPTAHEVAALRGLLSQASWAADQPPGHFHGPEDD